MFLIDLLFLIVFALLFSSVLTWGLGWRHPARTEATGTSVGLLFVILLLAMWVSRVWVRPFGPDVYGTPWVSLLVVGLLTSLVVMAVSLPGKRPRTAAEAIRQERDAGAVGVAFGLFFWILMAALIGATVAGYMID